MENNTMSVEQDVTEIKNKLVAMETSCQEAVAEANASVNSLTEKNIALESQLQTQTNEFTERETAMKKEIEEVKASASEELLALKTSLEAQISELSEAIAMKNEEMKKKEEEMKKMKAELDSANETVAAYKTKEAEMVKKEKMTKRKAALVDNGVEEDAALAFVEKYENIEDEAFDAMATLFAAMKMKKEDAMKMKMKAEEVAEAEEVVEPKVSASDLDNVETESAIDLTVGSDSSEEEENTTRAALVEFVYSKLGKKSK
jgi:chromosome segregation ATPase